jgi:hypothetical protein
MGWKEEQDPREQALTPRLMDYPGVVEPHAVYR